MNRNMNMSKRSQGPGKWMPLEPAVVKPLTNLEVMEYVRLTGMTEAEAREILEREARVTEYWINNIYQVAKRPAGDFVQLNIRRRDGKPIFRDWRHFQMIKNQLVGEECEGIELYPAESRKVDTGNKFHIWCIPDPTWRFPVDWTERNVMDHDSPKPGFRQRPMEDL